MRLVKMKVCDNYSLSEHQNLLMEAYLNVWQCDDTFLQESSEGSSIKVRF